MTTPKYKSLLVDIDAAVATITLNRPDELNPLDDDVLTELTSALAALSPGDAVRVIRIKGAGRAFCAGGNLKTVYDKFDYRPTQSGPSAWELGSSRTEMDRVWLRSLIDKWLEIFAYRKPIVAQVHGHCLGGGTELIGVCDAVFAAEGTRFGHPPVRAHGLTSTLGMWPFRIGMLKSKELLFTGDIIEAQEAERIGMINRAVPPDQLDEYVMAYCRRVAQVPLDFLSVTKQWINRWYEIAGLRTAATEGAEFNAILHNSPPFEEFVRIAKEHGLKAALDWRDGAFRPGGIAK